jgi:hypothetical protein
MTLKSLNEWNAEQSNNYRTANSNEPRPNGLACPVCGYELVDSQPNITLTSSPPQKNVYCEACEYTGYRVA